MKKSNIGLIAVLLLTFVDVNAAQLKHLSPSNAFNDNRIQQAARQANGKALTTKHKLAKPQAKSQNRPHLNFFGYQKIY